MSFKEEFYISGLISKQLKNELTALEQQDLNDWLSSSPDNRRLMASFNSEHEVNAKLTKYKSADKQAIWMKTLKLIHEKKPARFRQPLWKRIAVAASLAIFVFGAGLFYYQSGNNKQSNTIVYKNDVSPGKQGATLTLANGRKIKLSTAANGELANQAGVTILKTADDQLIYKTSPKNRVEKEQDQINTLSTAKGEIFKVRLPDGSTVHLNAASSLKYTSNLNFHGARRVDLDGEAYFEISEDKAHPFIVRIRGVEIEVLGTHFNVNAYADEPVSKTTLMRGSVKLTAAGRSQLLVPGQQAAVSSISTKISKIDTTMVIAWKDDKFNFDHQSIQEIMRMIGRWYNVDVSYDGPAPVQRFWGSVSRFEHASKVLNALEKTGNVKFRIDGRHIYVSKP